MTSQPDNQQRYILSIRNHANMRKMNGNIWNGNINGTESLMGVEQTNEKDYYTCSATLNIRAAER